MSTERMPRQPACEPSASVNCSHTHTHTRTAHASKHLRDGPARWCLGLDHQPIRPCGLWASPYPYPYPFASYVYRTGDAHERGHPRVHCRGPSPLSTPRNCTDGPGEPIIAAASGFGSEQLPVAAAVTSGGAAEHSRCDSPFVWIRNSNQLSAVDCGETINNNDKTLTAYGRTGVYSKWPTNCTFTTVRESMQNDVESAYGLIRTYITFSQGGARRIYLESATLWSYRGPIL